MVTNSCDIKFTGKKAEWGNNMHEYFCSVHNSIYWQKPATKRKYCFKISVLRRKQHKSLR